MPSIFSFFSGSGFLDLGFENSGFKSALVNEFHAPFLDAYKHSRKKLSIDEPEFGYALNSIEDFITNPALEKHLISCMTQLKSRGEMSGFIGGPPCPDFSVGGKNKGHEGENGRLSRTYVDVILKYSPDFFLFENVKGLWRTKRHREFYESLKLDLQSRGYVLTENLVNCIQYGAPQDRDRILLFGIKREHVETQLSKENIANMQLPCELFNWEEHIKFSRKSALVEPNWPERDVFVENDDKALPAGIIKELTVKYWFDKNDVENHPNSHDHFVPRAGLPKFQSIDEGDSAKKSYKRLHRWRYSPTAAYGNNEVHLHPFKARRISVSEALAIQSLPRSFELPADMSLSNKFKTIGNGVPYLASEGIAKTINNFLQKIE